MAKFKNKEDISEESTPEFTLVEPTKVEDPKYDFSQAFRLYKKNNVHASNWTEEAVIVFCKKRINFSNTHTLDSWFTVFEKY